MLIGYIRKYNFSKWIVFFTIILVTLHVFFVQTLLTINHDVGFLYQIAKHTTLTNIYQNYYEINPPLIVYIYKCILFIFSPTGLSDLISLRLGMILYIFTGIYFIRKNLISSSINYVNMLVFAFSIGMLFINPMDYLQREQFVLVGVFVYVSNCVTYLKNRSTSYVVRLFTIIFLSISIFLKPQYIVIVFFIELYMCISIKSIKSIFRLEMIGCFISGLFYVLYVNLELEEYFHIIVPFANFGYVSYFVDFKLLFYNLLNILLYSSFPVYILVKCKFDFQILMLIILALISSGCAYLIGHTGFSYHLVNILGIYISLLILSIISLFKRLYYFNNKEKILFVFVLFFISFLSYKIGMIKFVSVNYFTSINVLKRNDRALSSDYIVNSELLNLYTVLSSLIKPQDNMIFLSSTMSPAHILTFHLNGNWSGHFPVLWLLPRSYTESNDPRSITSINFTKEVLINDLKEKKPKIIVIESGEKLPRYPKGFQFLDIFTGSLEFYNEFYKYKILKKVPYFQEEFIIYERTND